MRITLRRINESLNLSAIRMYEKPGFAPTGTEFDDATELVLNLA